jgi:hypothetical protein
VLGYGLAVAPLSTAGLSRRAGTRCGGCGAALPGKRNGARAREPLETAARRRISASAAPDLPGRAHRARRDPRRAAELGRHIGELQPGSPLAGEARRLAEQHMPRLIEAFLALPRGAQTPDVCERLAASLATVADELGRLTAQMGHDRLLSFETQERFIQSRYKERGW